MLLPNVLRLSLLGLLQRVAKVEEHGFRVREVVQFLEIDQHAVETREVVALCSLSLRCLTRASVDRILETGCNFVVADIGNAADSLPHSCCPTPIVEASDSARISIDVLESNVLIRRSQVLGADGLRRVIGCCVDVNVDIGHPPTPRKLYCLGLRIKQTLDVTITTLRCAWFDRAGSLLG